MIPKVLCSVYLSSKIHILEKEKQDFGLSLRKAFINDPELFTHKNCKIQYISDTVFEMYNKSKSKLGPLFAEEHIEKSGIFITSKGSFTNTYFYTVLKSAESAEDSFFKIMLIQFSKYSQNDVPNLDLYAANTVGDDGKLNSQVLRWKGFKNTLEEHYAWLIGLIMFLKYADIETKIVAGQRRERHVGNKYVNETNRNIEIIDSTYYTNIVREEGFWVEGFFRWQPYGPGLIYKRLQWINRFEKHGYVRKAKKQINN